MFASISPSEEKNKNGIIQEYSIGLMDNQTRISLLLSKIQSFQNLRLFFQSEWNRVTWLCSSFECDMKKRRFWLSKLQNRFEPWAEWPCEEYLNYHKDLEYQKRQTFVKLLEVPSGMDLLANDKKVQLMAEYATLHQNAITAVTF